MIGLWWLHVWAQDIVKKHKGLYNRCSNIQSQKMPFPTFDLIKRVKIII